MSTSPIKAFVIGDPVAHSRSPLIHGYWLKDFAIGGTYERVHVLPENLTEFVRSFRDRGFAGGNVTIPHKEGVFRLVNQPTDLARRLGAVNTLWADEAGRIHGHNTDVEGFVRGLDGASPGWDGARGTALVLGAGGAARAVVAGLAERGIGRILVANRTSERAVPLRELAPGRVEIIDPAGVEDACGEADLLVNTTSQGMHGELPFGIDLGRLPGHAVVADIVYVPLETPLLAAARARGLKTADGLAMLLHQAVFGFEQWFGRRPEVTSDLHALVAADVLRTA